MSQRIIIVTDIETKEIKAFSSLVHLEAHYPEWHKLGMAAIFVNIGNAFRQNKSYLVNERYKVKRLPINPEKVSG